MNGRMIDLAQRTRDYLRAFSARDLDALAEHFTDQVVLRDWDVGTVSGKSAVLATNQKLFASVTSIEARPLTIHVAGSTTIAELEIHVDGKLALLVADVIDFDEHGHITALRAYRGT